MIRSVRTERWRRENECLSRELSVTQIVVLLYNDIALLTQGNLTAKEKEAVLIRQYTNLEICRGLYVLAWFFQCLDVKFVTELLPGTLRI